MPAPKTRRTGKVAGPPPPAAPAPPPPVLVTYRGPTDPKDRSTAVIVRRQDPRRDETFPLNQPVKTTRSTAQRLADMAGHTFTTEPASPEGDQSHARQ